MSAESQDGVPKYEGPRMVTLITGEIAFNDSPAWRHECEARDIAAYAQHDRDAWLAEIERVRGPAEAARLRKTIEEVIAVTAQGTR